MKLKTQLFFNLFLAGLLLLNACSSSGGDGAKVSGKNLTLVVSGSRSFNTDIVDGQISYYRMTLTAPDLADPFIAQFDGSAESAQMLGVPTGGDRTLIIEAVNPNGLVIRRGKKEGVSIVGGETTAVEVVMNSVPIFTNISQGNTVAGNRIQFEIFGEPSSKLKVFEVTDEGNTPISSLSDHSAWVDTDNEEGTFSMDPSSFSYGVHTFEVCDEETHESSQIQMTFYQPEVRPGVGINSGGQVRQQGSEMVMVSAGASYFRLASQDKGNLGNQTFLDIIPLLY